MRFLACDIERAGRDAGPYDVWWRRASVPAIFRCMKAHWYQSFGHRRGDRLVARPKSYGDRCGRTAVRPYNPLCAGTRQATHGRPSVRPYFAIP